MAAKSTMADAPVKRDLKAELTAARQQLAAAEAAAEALKGEEATSLESDESFNSFTRRQKLAAREVERLTKVVRDIEVAIDDELAQRELAVFEARYAAVKARNHELIHRLVAFRDEVAPALLKLVADLARDQEDVDDVNRFVSWERIIRDADGAVRDRPSQQEEVISTEVIELWCIQGRPLPEAQQSYVVVDEHGNGSIAANFGRKGIPCHLRKFRRVVKVLFRPASDAVPLWRSLVLPRLDRIDAPICDLRRAVVPWQALQLLAQERREPPRDTAIEMIPLDHDGNPIKSPSTYPTIEQEAERRSDAIDW
jgi:hypothetical protein